MRYYWDLAGVVGGALDSLVSTWIGVGRPGDLQCIVGGSIPAESQVSPNNLAAFMHACIRRAAVPHAACSTSFVYSFRYHSTLGQQSSARDRKHPSPKRHIDERSLQTWHIRAQNRNLLLGRSHCGRGGECDYVGTIVRLVRRHRPW